MKKSKLLFILMVSMIYFLFMGCEKEVDVDKIQISGFVTDRLDHLPVTDINIVIIDQRLTTASRYAWTRPDGAGHYHFTIYPDNFWGVILLKLEDYNGNYLQDIWVNGKKDSEFKLFGQRISKDESKQQYDLELYPM